jgi:hypothetical protein
VLLHFGIGINKKKMIAKATINVLLVHKTISFDNQAHISQVNFNFIFFSKFSRKYRGAKLSKASTFCTYRLT